MTSKNSNYAAAESYLTFQHNEYTGLPILDEKGRPKLRDSYLLDTLECGESSFAMACLIANRKYGKNGGREGVKTHHYIVSFDPKDAVENGLTMEKAQALGLQFCKLVEVASYLAALGRQGSKRRQCILAALRHHNGVLDVHAVQDAADEFGLGEVEFFAGVCDPQFFFCGHSDFDDVCLSFSRRVIAVLLCVYVRTFHFSHIRPPVKMINARSGMERTM